MSNIDLKTYLPANLTNEFWTDYLDAWSDEFILLKTDLVDIYKNYYYLRNVTDINQFIEIAKTYGVTIDRSVDESVDFARLFCQLINYKAKYKTSYIGYDFISKIINKKIYVYNLYRYLNAFRRGINLPEVLDELNDVSLDMTAPFIDFLPEFYFSSEFVLIDSLDNGGFMDDTFIPNLDGIFSQTTTNHMNIEYRVFDLIIEDSQEFFMTSLYLEYLLTGSLYNKKATEYPHVGFQVNALTDDSGLYNNNDPGADYTTPDIKQIAQITDKSLLDELDLENTFYKVQIGDGIAQPISSDQDIWINQPLRWYDFEGTGLTIIDKGTDGVDGSLTAGVSRISDSIVNTSIELSGDPERALATNINVAATDLSFSFWVNGDLTTQTDTTPTLMYIHQIALELLQIYISGTSLKVNYIGSTSTQTLTYATNILDNTDRFIVVTLERSTNTVKLYVNGIERDSINIAGNLPTLSSGYDIRLGWANVTDTYYIGLMDDVRYHNQLLTPAQILYKYNNRYNSIESIGNLVAESTENIKERYVDNDWFIVTGFFPYTVGDIEDEIDITEIALLNSSDQIVAYVNFPIARYKKKFHISFQFYIKRL